MSLTYGTLQGSRGPATRCGGRDGVKVACQSYDGSVIVSNYYDNNNTLKITLGTNNSSSCYSSSGSSFSGTFQELKDLLKLHEDIKAKRVSVVRHRNKK